ncbi:MAG: DUF4166 domain-containing protein [Pikeienuella sp.]
MKVLLLGGYGVFGERLARLLLRDGHAVTIAGRNLAAAEALAKELGCAAARMDRRGDPAPLKGHEVVIDAAGPFQAYGDDPYRLPRAAIEAGLHYLDLSDDASFCAGVAALDGMARKAGLCVVSGLSSVPALSSAAARALAGDERPLVIETAILPGDRAPRGLSVIAAVLLQVGRPMRVWRGGEWTRARGWSAPRRYRLPGGLVRQGWRIGAPDLALFPAHFGAGTVEFRAGPELALLRYGLAAVAALRRFAPIPASPAVTRGFKLAADLVARFGGARGGMSVMVVAGRERRWWRLLAEDGDGPFTPGVAARALLRRPALPAGAGPALETVTLEEAEAAMADLNMRFERASAPFIPLFQQALGPDFARLPEPVRATHEAADVSRWRGRAAVSRGEGLWSRLLGRIFGFPPAGEDIPVEVCKTVNESGETWRRRFGARVFRSHLALGPQGLTERFGPFTFLIGLNLRDGALHYPVRSGRLGPLPLPRRLLPVSEAREYVEDGLFHFDVKLRAPATGDLLVHYRGSLAPAPQGDPRAPDRA